MQQQQPEYNTLGYDQSFMQPQHGNGDVGLGLNMGYSQLASHQDMQGCGPGQQGGMQSHYAPGLETLFEPTYATGDLVGHGSGTDFQYSDMIHDYQ